MSRIPRPVIDVAQLSGALTENAARAQTVKKSPLSHTVRTLGEELRQFGRRTYEDSKASTESSRGRLRAHVTRVRKSEGDHPLLVLRAIQAELFVAALGRFEKTQKVDAELIELGGDFLRHAKAEGWLLGHRFTANEQERTALFLVRFTDLTGLRQTLPFALPPAIELTALRYALTHSRSHRVNPGASLHTVERIASLDRSYPLDLAKGILELKAHQLEPARSTLARFVSQNSQGTYHLWAKNAWLYAASGETAVKEPYASLDP